MAIGAISYGIAAVAFGLVAAIALALSARTLQARAFIVALGLTIAWAVVFALSYAGFGIGPLGLELLEFLRIAGWLAFAWSSLHQGSGRGEALSGSRFWGAWSGLTFLGLVLLVATALLPDRGLALLIGVLAFVALSIFGLALVFALLRRLRDDWRWKMKFTIIALAALFLYDLTLYSDMVFTGAPDPLLLQARGIASAMTAPLLAVSFLRSQGWRQSIAISHNLALRSTALFTAGLYLVAMGIVSYLLQGLHDTPWGQTIPVLLIFVMAIALFVGLLSGKLRSRGKIFISKNFFSYLYDYRTEWLRFMEMMAVRTESESLEKRVVQAIANIMESPGGALWHRRGAVFEPRAVWNLSVPEDVVLREEEPLLRLLSEHNRVTDVRELAQSSDLGVALPDGLKQVERLWLLVPLHHRGGTDAFVGLAQSRAQRSLTWEDYDILKIVGQQAASYLAEQSAAEALIQHEQFERFSRKTAYVMHDIKNIVSQLSLLARNFPRYKDRPEFIDDAQLTLSESVEKMNRLLARISEDRTADAEGSINLSGLLDRLRHQFLAAGIPLELQNLERECLVRGDRDKLESIISNLVRNALDATDGAGPVRLSLESRSDGAMLTIADDGPGMDPEFCRTALFHPFRSTKQKGFGIGMAQVREYARELGGDVTVLSEEGQGTTVRVLLPLCEQRNVA